MSHDPHHPTQLDSEDERYSRERLLAAAIEELLAENGLIRPATWSAQWTIGPRGRPPMARAWSRVPGPIKPSLRVCSAA